MRKFLILMFILLTPTTTFAYFNDLSTTPWAIDAINSLYSQGIVSGKTSTNFGPNEYCTRADFTVMLCRAFEIPTSNIEQFDDINKEAYYSEYVNGAALKSYVFGESATIFNPDKYVTRQDVALLVYNCLKNKGFKLNSDKTILNNFKDVTQISSYAKNAFACLCNMNVLQGSSGFLNPSTKMTRAEISVMYNKLLEVYVNGQSN